MKTLIIEIVIGISVFGTMSSSVYSTTLTGQYHLSNGVDIIIKYLVQKLQGCMHVTLFLFE